MVHSNKQVSNADYMLIYVNHAHSLYPMDGWKHS